MPIGWIAAAGAITGIAGAAASSSAASDQAAAAQNAQQISLNEFNTITQQEAPYMQGGYGALNALEYGLGITPQNPLSTSNTSSGVTSPNTGQSPTNTLNPGNPASAGTPGFGLGANSSQIYIGPNGQRIPGPLGGSGVPMIGGGAGGSSSYEGAPPSGQGTGLGYGSLLTPFTADYMKQYSPAYQFQLQQGQQGVLNTDSAGSGALSGAALKDLTSYNQNYANTAYGNAFNQYQTQLGNTYSRLAGLAQLGQASASNTGQQGTALAGQAAQSATNIGTAQAGGAVGTANAISGGLSSASLPWLYGNSSSGVSASSADTLGLGDY